MSFGSDSSFRIPSNFGSLEFQDDHAPLWAFVTIKDKLGDGGGNKLWSCNFCAKVVKSSYLRVKVHLLRISGAGVALCPKVIPEYLVDLKRICEEAENKIKPKTIPLPSAAPATLSQKRKKKGSDTLERAFNVDERNQLRVEIARMFYSAGLSFHLARNPYYVSSYSFAANHNVSGFLPPSYNALRTSLLQQKRSHIERLLQPIKSLLPIKGVTLVSDGWTNVQRRPLINFMAVSEGGSIFLKAVDGSKEYKDKHYMASIMKDVINEVGPKNVVQIITDNAPVCKAAGMLIEAEFHHVFWTLCVVHTLNLALKNICAARNIDGNENVFNECHWITLLVDDASFIKTFIMTHSMRLAIFNEFSSLKLLSVAETRFASMVVMLKRLKLLKRVLQNMVISDQWNSYREDDVGKAAYVKELILNDIWWDKLDYILSFTDTIYSMLRKCDIDASTLHLVYEMWDSMIEKVKTVIYRHEEKETNEVFNFYDVVHSILNFRWSKSCTPLHCLAHSLNPRYYSEEWLREAPNRVPPHQDDEVSRERNKCLKRYFPNAEERKNVFVEFSNFSSCAADFASFDSIEDRWTLDPKSWWVMHGSSTPLLQKLALKLLVQPCS
ncbi:uncharacterized protein LOC113862485 [Abrus precatorius]|uniref:Uncharacterized protein LOC113862485 n=1 Tax=Abrus precatorius TaxID=3816 RepID=A0A8B8L503_ABRPR|nr:uncharacterized protein LOC113862485 [Abrus precatorius]